MNTPFPILPNLPPFQILSNPPLSPPTPTPTVLSVVLSLWLNGWSRHIWCAILLNDSRDLHMSSLGTLVPEGPRCAFYATKQGVKVPEVWHILWFFTGTQILYQTHTHTHTHARTHARTHTHSGASRLTRPYKYIFTPPVMCSQQLPFYINWFNE